MRRPSLLLLLILLAGTPLMACAQVYQWTDAHGTVHYADTPPPQGVHYKDVKIVGNTVVGSSQAAPAPAAIDDKSDTATPPPSRPMRDTPANRRQLCTTIKTNIALLSKDGPVVVKNTGGKEQLLSKTQRAQKLQQARQRQQTYCNGRSAAR
ncbi:MAG TPA: DUF4124 domain-containing protein [Rhodanobacteraceae bacterium]